MSLLSVKTKISTPLVEATRDFYLQLFKLVVVEDWDEPHDRGVILAASEDRLEALIEIHHSLAAVNLSGMSLQFRVDDIDRFVDFIRDKAVFEGPKARSWGARYVYLRDPNDIQVVVYDTGL